MIQWLERGRDVTESKLVRGAAVLAAAAVISKLLGVIQKIPLQNVAGDEAFGIYSAVYPFYTFVLLIATAGIPVAISKVVSENIETNQLLQAQYITRLAYIALSVTGILFFLILFLGAPWFASLIGSANTMPAIRSVSWAILFVPIMAVLRGYFQGKQEMMPTAVSQVLEQTVRVITMVVLLILLTRANYSSDWVAAGATFGSVTGALAALMWMWLMWKREGKTNTGSRNKGFVLQLKADWHHLRPVLLYAMPVCLGAVGIPLLTMVDTFTVPRLLAASITDPSMALHEFGVYARGQPLVQLIIMLFSSVSVALVPAISEANIRNEIQLIQARSELALRLTWWIGLAATIGLIVIAEPVNRMFYLNAEGTAAIAILSISIAFCSVQIVSTSLLQGLGLARLPAYYLLIATVLKIGLNIWLVPRWGIEGAAFAAVAAFLTAVIFNIRALLKHTNISFSIHNYVWKPMLAVGTMAAGLYILSLLFPLFLMPFDLSPRLEQTVISLVSVGVGSLLFLLLALRLEAVHRTEWANLPWLDRKLNRIFKLKK